jgi:hypothetical protein
MRMNEAAAINAARVRNRNRLAGKWTYRSYLDRPGVTVGGDAAKALGLIFGEGVMTVADTDANIFRAVLDMGGGHMLDLKGTARAAAGRAPAIVQARGIGRAGTPTDGWEYDYLGYLAWTWRDGVAQVPAIVGTVVRATPHGTANAGVVASFIATKQPCPTAREA